MRCLLCTSVILLAFYNSKLLNKFLLNLVKGISIKCCQADLVWLFSINKYNNRNNISTHFIQHELCTVNEFSSFVYAFMLYLLFKKKHIYYSLAEASQSCCLVKLS
jgi:hypothetical protein